MASNKSIKKLAKTRNHAYDQLAFNKKYPDVLAAQLKEKNDRKYAFLEQDMKDRLLKLELEAVPAAEKNKYLTDVEIKKLTDKQVLPRKAIEQDYLRAVEKVGEEQAEKERAEKLAKLDGQIESLKASLAAKYPLDDPKMPSEEAIAKFKKAEEEELKKLSEIRAKMDSDAAATVAAKREKLEKKNVSLQAEYEKANEAIKKSQKLSDEEFGKDTVLLLQNLKMYFSGVKAVDDMSFDVKKGEIFGLIGPNGAGKTTIFNCITQFYKPTAGNVYYRDRFGTIVDLTDYATHDIISCGISRTFQNLEMVLHLPVIDNMLVGAHMLYHSNLFDQFVHTKRLKDEEAVQRALAMEILEILGLKDYAYVYPKGLPYGVLKKIELGRTLMTHPELIILDEPAAGLNDAETADLATLIKEIREKFDCTILLVEHDMNLVMSICDRICVTSFGHRLALGLPAEVQANKDVQEAYLGASDE